MHPRAAVTADRTAAAQGWTVVIPVKSADTGKTRLAVPGVDRAWLARAVALDTIRAAAASDAVARVIVVTADDEVAAAAIGPGVGVAADPGGGLNAAIAAGMAAAGPDAARAALLGDLPSLAPADLAAALDAARRHPRGVVADAEGAGSTLATAAPGVPWASAFGDDSFARHLALGCAPIDVPPESSMRRDVDTLQQLRDARDLGLGPRTTALLRAAELGSSAPPPTARLRLRELREDDLDHVAALLGDPAVMTYYPSPKSRAEAGDWIAWSRRNYVRYGLGLWAVETRDGVFLGDCGLTWQPVAGSRRLEVGYHIRADAQGSGYATEAAAACRDLALELGFDDLVAVIHPDNAASIRVARKLGMSRERDDIHPSGRDVVIERMPLTA
jgi:2-phospho-L-lactate/phosphoenolpyruvate guanylyltransferase